ncbi:MAG: ABC transporter permease [bacterium]|nr:ABC transporter permease [bacterium]
MAAVSSPLSAPPSQTVSFRERFRITRVLIFSLFFLLVGGFILLSTPRQLPGDIIATLTFEEGIPDLRVSVVPYAIVVSLLYIVGGVMGLALSFMQNAPQGFRRAALGLLVINGVLIIPTVLILAAAGKSTNMITMLASSLRAATPIVIGALAGIWCERSGVVNVGIEGMMLTGACFGFLAFSFIANIVPGTTGLYLGVVVAVISGGVMALLHAWLCITYKTDQIISGTVINILALGLTSFLRLEFLVNADAARETIRPLNQIVAGVPLLGDVMQGLANIPILGSVIFSGKPIFLSMFVLLIVTHVVLYYTRWGLRTRAVGENPHAADTLGIEVQKNRYINVIIGGLFAGLAGAWFSLETTGSFDDNMTSGTGFIALAAMIFGKWTPFGAFAGGLLFGFASALDTRFQILDVPVPSQFVQMTPYIVTIVVLAGLVGRAIAPKAVGTPYTKE